MLIVLQGAPAATPAEAMLDEETIAEVARRDLITEASGAVGVWTASLGLHKERAVLPAAHTGIVQRIDVDGHTSGMVRQLARTCDGTIAVARRVVGLHGALVVVTIVGDGTDALNGVTGTVELGEYLAQVGRDGFVANDDALLRTSLEIDMLYAEGVEHDTIGLGRSNMSHDPDGDYQQEATHAVSPYFLINEAIQRMATAPMMAVPN